ncbi:TlpA family protein disulfide reductase [Propionispira raffinosivorans]|uniref:TlpA family protein disulfide reductase n=1 Tax=Propionispira raffinosivorans TaxID=86959 RepID=UPI00039E955A|nr:redoxin domain-containing protein [Propionispira raffinosivorans]
MEIYFLSGRLEHIQKRILNNDEKTRLLLCFCKKIIDSHIERDGLVKVKYLLLVIVFVFTVCSSNNAVCAELKDGDLIPTTGETVGVHAGDTAPDLTLFDLNGNLKNISFKNSPAILISLYRLNGDSNKIQQLVDLYAKRKDIKLLFVVRDEAEYVKVSLMKHDFDIPVYFERKKEFSTKYNIGVPTMVIIDKKGIVRYNNTFWVDANSMDSFIENLISGKGNQTPRLLYSAPKEVKKEVPRLINLGENVPVDVFRDLEGAPVKLDYKGKPTVIFYWMSFTNDKFLNQMMPVMQSLYEENGKKANFYTINGSGERRFTMSILDRYYSSFPTLVGGDVLQYSRVFPAFIIIDSDGVLRYRTSTFPNVEELNTLLTEIIDG